MDGVLVVNKAKGMTSHDVVDLIRKRFRIKKVGHAGTLDPMATGVLVTLLGSYTKLSSQFMSEDKEYEGSLIFGGSSDTGDAWGKITDSGKSVKLADEEIKAVFSRFLGETEQLPPMYSSVKVNGKKLYELARKGLTAELTPRKITIKNLDVLKINLPEVFFKLTCSKGTYIRQLCVDIGGIVGCGAYMAGLNRTRSGRFAIDKSVSIDDIRKMMPSDLEKVIVTI